MTFSSESWRLGRLKVKFPIDLVSSEDLLSASERDPSACVFLWQEEEMGRDLI